MAELQFFFGTMGSGKSTMALQIHHNLRSRRLRGLLCTQLDRQGAQVSSRLGVSAEAVDVAPGVDLFALARTERAEHGELHFLVCDEAQFYTPGQIEQLARVVDELGADVYAFGLLTSFQGQLFPGTARLMELADRCTSLQVESRCWCGRRATHNARLVDGVQVYDGALMVVDDGGLSIIDDAEAEVTYELRCRRHWLSGQGEPTPEHLHDLTR
jgi:thymidine kinase